MNSSDSFRPYKPIYDRDGFVIVRQFLTGAKLADLQHHLQRYITNVVPDLPDSDAFFHDRSRPETLKQMQHMEQDAYFDQCRRQPPWTDLAAALIGEPVEGQGPEWFNKPPQVDHSTPPHQDNYYFNLTPPNVATLWLALDPVDETNGCLRYVPGSHRMGIRPHATTSVLGFSQGIVDYTPQDVQSEVVVTLQPGDLVAHHGETIHRAEPNRSPDRQRRAFAIVFRGASCRRNESAYANYLAQLKSQHETMRDG